VTRTLLALAGLYGLCGVALGAFGAHALRSRLPEERLANVELAVRYLFFTIPGLIAVAWLAGSCGGEPFELIAAWGLGLGALLFSGSLVVLAFTGNRKWGSVTPIGGVLLLIGWAALIAAALAMTTDVGDAIIRPLASC
jgi:uncharacterized membrane protein YgdD (TMEM256/DUF423 family)